MAGNRPQRSATRGLEPSLTVAGNVRHGSRKRRGRSSSRSRPTFRCGPPGVKGESRSIRGSAIYVVRWGLFKSYGAASPPSGPRHSEVSATPRSSVWTRRSGTHRPACLPPMRCEVRLAGRGSTSYLKRQKEQKRTAKAAAKRAARQERRDTRESGPATDEVLDDTSPMAPPEPAPETAPETAPAPDEPSPE